MSDRPVAHLNNSGKQNEIDPNLYGPFAMGARHALVGGEMLLVRGTNPPFVVFFVPCPLHGKK